MGDDCGKASVGRASVGRASVGRASVGRASVGRARLLPSHQLGWRGSAGEATAVNMFRDTIARENSVPVQMND
jgi:hypothetical protein